MASFVIVSGNIVLRKPAFQSSTYKSHSSEASNANDGDARTNWRTDGTCSHTKYDPQAWWAVDLLRQYSLAYVTLTGWDDILGECRSYIEGILPKGPYRHACARQKGPFWQDTLDMCVVNGYL